MPSVCACLDADAIIEKWQVVKELAGIGDANTQAALRQSVEDWLRSQVPKPEEIDIYTKAGYRSYYIWQRYFTIANEFGIESSFILEGLREYVTQLHAHIEKWVEPNDEENWRRDHMVGEYEELLKTNEVQK